MNSQWLSIIPGVVISVSGHIKKKASPLFKLPIVLERFLNQEY